MVAQGYTPKEPIGGGERNELGAAPKQIRLGSSQQRETTSESFAEAGSGHHDQSRSRQTRSHRACRSPQPRSQLRSLGWGGERSTDAPRPATSSRATASSTASLGAARGWLDPARLGHRQTADAPPRGNDRHRGSRDPGRCHARRHVAADDVGVVDRHSGGELMAEGCSGAARRQNSGRSEC